MKEIKFDGKIVGFVKDNTYYTRRDSRTHFYQKRQGYPISISILDRIREMGVKDIIIVEHRKDGTIHHYKVFVSDFDNVTSFKEDGYDEQKCIPLRRMSRLYEQKEDS